MTEPEGGAPSIRERLDLALTEYLVDLPGDDLREITVEAVAEVAGVSRATAYRYLGSRDELLHRAAISLARVHMARCEAILARTPTVVAKLEESFAYTVRETSTDVLLQLLLRSPRAQAIDDALRGMTAELIGSAVRAGQADGQVRTDVSADELIAWQLEQLYVVLRLGLDEPRVRIWVRQFMAPVLRPPGGGDGSLRPQLLAVLDDVRSRITELEVSAAAARSALGE